MFKIPKLNVDFSQLRRNGFSKDALYILEVAIEAAHLAIVIRRSLLDKKNFIEVKKDGSFTTTGDKLVTRHILRKLSKCFGAFGITEEYPGKYLSRFRATAINYDLFFKSPIGLVLDGIDGTLFYIQPKLPNFPRAYNFSIWFSLAKKGKPWCSFFVEVGPDDSGIVEVVIAEAGRGAWDFKPVQGWVRMQAEPWNGLDAPNVAHGLPFRDKRFKAFAEFLRGPSFRGREPKWSEVVPIGRATIDVASGKNQLFVHALLPPWDWHPAHLILMESGHDQDWYRIDGDGALHFLPKYPMQADYSPDSRLCMNFGAKEFVKIARDFLLKQDGKVLFAP